MAEYIEREAALQAARKYGTANGSALGRHSGLADCIEAEIIRLPAADVAPVRHGRWIDEGFSYICSECGDRTLTPESDKYCPNCGAKMD